MLKRHDAYTWGPTGVYSNPEPVRHERMIWRIVPEETTRMVAMMACQADFCHWNPLQAIETVKKAPNLTVYEPTADFAMYYWGFKSRARTSPTEGAPVAVPPARPRLGLIEGRWQICDHPVGSFMASDGVHILAS